MKACGNEAGNGEKLTKGVLTSGLLLASLGAQFKWGPERLHGNLLGIVPLRDRKQEVLPTNSRSFLGEVCSWGINSTAFLTCPACG